MAAVAADGRVAGDGAVGNGQCRAGHVNAAAQGCAARSALAAAAAESVNRTIAAWAAGGGICGDRAVRKVDRATD